MKIYDLEQDILKFSCILDDLEDITSKTEIDCEDLKTINSYYKIKYDKLWACFEEVCKEYLELRRKNNEEYLEIRRKNNENY